MSRVINDIQKSHKNRLVFVKKPFSKAIKFSVLTGILVSTLAYANENEQPSEQALPAITVTAEKREADLQDIPSSISVKTAEEIEDAEISSVTELSQYTPNLHIFTWGGRRDTNIFIRGIGPGAFTEPTAGIYVDGVNYTNNGSFDMDLIDIERIEVLRGPQGTLYGGNSLTGVLNITTKKPTNETEGQISLTSDDLSRQRLSTRVSTPLINDELFFGIAFSGTQNNGHIDNNNTQAVKKFGERDDISAKTKLRWTPNKQLEILWLIDYEQFEGDSYAFAPTASLRKNPDEINHDFRGQDDRDALGTSLTINWSGDIDFSSITGWRDWESVNSADQDAGADANNVFHSSSVEDQNQFTQEFRWSSSNESFSWIGGLYAYQSEFKSDTVNTVNNPAQGVVSATDTITTTKDDKGYAVFGQVDFFLNDQFTLTTGLRHDEQKRKATIDQQLQSRGNSSETFKGEKNFDELLPKLALSYTTANDNLIYGSISEGYRAGGFDTLYPNLSRPTFDSENSTNYELGFKTRILDERLELNAALFWIDIEDQQVQLLVPNTFTIFTDNAAKSNSRGIELESRYKPSENWSIRLSGTYTDTEYEEYQALNFTTFAIDDYSGNQLPNAPRVTANLSIQNRQPISDFLTLFTQIDNNYVGSYFFDAQNSLKQDSYNLLNIKVGIEGKNWGTYLWSKNALDEYYSANEFNFGTPTGEAGDPRSVGVTFSAKL